MDQGRSYFCILSLLILFLGLVSMQDVKMTCEMGAFLEEVSAEGTEEEKVWIDGGPIPGADEKSFSSCDSDEDKTFCGQIVLEELKTVDIGTSGGNLTFTIDQTEGITLGDYLCDKAELILQDQVQNKEVWIYWRFCSGPWTKSDFRMKPLLCCDSGLYTPCNRFRDEL